MKKIGWFGKVVFLLNSVAAVLLLAGYLLPYIPPSYFPRLAVLSLLLPVLLLINLFFFLYWLLRFKRKMILSAVVLLIGFPHLSALWQFNSNEPSIAQGFSLMSYNVHSFTHHGQTPRSVIGPKMKTFIDSISPDILCLQEYNPSISLSEKFPYHYAKMTNSKQSFGQVIYSKYPIIHQGSIDFPQSGNNSIYADIVIEKDTLRVYNIHFQSFKLSPSFSNLQQEDSKRLLGRMADAFKKQEAQLEMFLAHEQTAGFPVIIAGDFNNSAFSYVYHKAKGDKLDAFIEAGSGSGRTFVFDFLPLRIDFILNDAVYEVNQFQTFDQPLSDHYPIMARFTPVKQAEALLKP